jgi:hypothetical protein
MYGKEGVGLTGTQLFITTAFILFLFIAVAILCSANLLHAYITMRGSKNVKFITLLVCLLNCIIESMW